MALTLPSFESTLPTCSQSEFETERQAGWFDLKGADQVALTLPSLESPLAPSSESELETERETLAPLPTNAPSESVTSACCNSGIRIDLDEGCTNGYNCAISNSSFNML